MIEIMVEETSATSKQSLSDALAKAIQSALQGYDGQHNLKLTVIVEGFTIQNGEFNVSVKILIIDPVLEEEKAYHESDKELEDRINAGQNLNEQMHSAIYSGSVFNQNDAVVDAIENRIEIMADGNSDRYFNVNDDEITLVASPAFHERLNQDIKSFEKPTAQKSYDAPGLDLGGGGSSSGSKDEAA